MVDPVAVIGTIIAVLDFAISRFEKVRERREGERQDRFEARLALLDALTQTRQRLKNLPRHQNVPEPDPELRRLWQEAAAKLWRADPDLANTMLVKAEYWMNPARWKGTAAEEAKIALSNIEDELTKMRDG